MTFAAPVTTRVQIHDILLTTDFSEISELALGYAVNMARCYGSNLVITHVVPNEPYLAVPLEPIPVDIDVFWEREKKNLARFAASKSLEEIPHEAILRRGELWSVISDVIESKKIDFVITGTHGRKGLRKVFMGSAAEKIYRQATCPVLTINPESVSTHQSNWPPKRILFATDFFETSLHALPYALSLAEENQAVLTLLHVAPLVPYQYKDSVTEANRKRLQALLPDGSMCTADCVVTFDFPAQGILEIAHERQVDLVVLGVSRHASVGLTSHLPWSVASDVVSAAPCPVLTVRG